MGKFKLAKGAKGKSKGPSARGAVPCIFFLISGMALLFFLFFMMVKPG